MGNLTTLLLLSWLSSGDVWLLRFAVSSFEWWNDNIYWSRDHPSAVIICGDKSSSHRLFLFFLSASGKCNTVVLFDLRPEGLWKLKNNKHNEQRRRRNVPLWFHRGATSFQRLRNESVKNFSISSATSALLLLVVVVLLVVLLHPPPSSFQKISLKFITFNFILFANYYRC